MCLQCKQCFVNQNFIYYVQKKVLVWENEENLKKPRKTVWIIAYMLTYSLKIAYMLTYSLEIACANI